MPVSIESEFVRPQLTFETEFGQYRNWWARDTRIGGNAFTILMYLLSHKQDFRITQSKAQMDLELGRDAFLAARRRLENAGFLKVHEHRYPAGTVTADGRAIGGQRRIVFELLDPEAPEKLRRPSTNSQPGLSAPVANVTSESPHEYWDEASADYPLRLSDEVDEVPGEASADNPLRLSDDQFGTDSDAPLDEVPDGALDGSVSDGFVSEDSESGAKATAGNPALGFPRLKEDQVKKTKSSSSDVSASTTAVVSPPDDDEDVVVIDRGLETLLAELHPRLDVHRLVSRLGRDYPALALHTLDLGLAASEIVTGASRRIGDPVAYVATSIIAEPGRWVKTGLLDEPASIDDPFPARRELPRRPPTAAECAEAGHQWFGLWMEACRVCGGEREGWREDRDGQTSGKESAA